MIVESFELMSLPELTEARKVLLSHANDPELVNEIKDIILCAPSRIAAQLHTSDYEKLSEFILLPRDAEDNLNLRGARQELTNLLNNVPAFRSQNYKLVCMSIVSYYTEHPEEIKINTQSRDPAWYQKITPTNSPSGSPIGSPRLRRPSTQAQTQEDPDFLT